MAPEIANLLWVAMAIGLAGIITILGMVNILAGADDVSERLDTYALVPEDLPRPRSDRQRARVMRWRLRLNSMLAFFASEELNLRLVSANWAITETEYILIRFWSVVVGLTAGWLIFRSPISGIGFAIIAFIGPDIYLRRSILKRRLAFERQLIDVLILVKGAVRAGVSFLQALDIVISEMKAPASEEFRRVRREVGLGLPLGQALGNLHTRMENPDLYLLVTAININNQVGGNLSTMLEAVTTTIRERVRLFSEVRALTSQQRYSGYILTMLPFITAGILFILNPKYISQMFKPGPILCIPIGALIMVILGNIIVRMMSKIDI
jgi:tight adherence protein B